MKKIREQPGLLYAPPLELEAKRSNRLPNGGSKFC
jgi:hypothetical protein